MATPVLEDPDTINTVQFNNWETRWQDFVKMVCVLEEIPGVAGRQAELQSALLHDITKNAPYAWENFHACAITRFQNPQQLSWAGLG